MRVRRSTLGFVRLVDWLVPCLVGNLPRSSRGSEPDLLVVCELEGGQAEEVTADLSAILPPDEFRLETRVVESSRELFDSPTSAPLLLTPRLWAKLSDEERTRGDVHLVSYVIKRQDLEELGGRLGWRSRRRDARDEAQDTEAVE